MKKATDKSVTLAAQVWCRPECGHIEMDVVLAQAFAELLDEQEIKIRECVVNEFKNQVLRSLIPGVH